MPIKTLSGTVISDINDKTIVVLVNTRRPHKLYKKIVTTHKKYHVHDPSNRFKKGSLVTFRSTKPISKKKKWIVLDKP